MPGNDTVIWRPQGMCAGGMVNNWNGQTWEWRNEVRDTISELLNQPITELPTSDSAMISNRVYIIAARSLPRAAESFQCAPLFLHLVWWLPHNRSSINLVWINESECSMSSIRKNPAARAGLTLFPEKSVQFCFCLPPCFLITQTTLEEQI